MGGKRLNMSDEERKVHRAKIVKASRLKSRMLDEQRFLEIAASKKWIWRQLHPEVTKKEAEVKKTKRLQRKESKSKKMNKRMSKQFRAEVKKLLRSFFRC